MVKDHHRARHRARERRIVRQLMMVYPRVIGQPTFAEPRHAAPEIRVLEQALRRASRNAQRRAALVARPRMPDAPEQAARGDLMRVQDGVQVLPPQIRMRDDPGNLRLRRLLRRPQRRRRHELCLAHREQMLRPIRPVSRPALHEHRLHHLVPVLRVGPQLLEIIFEMRLRPEMVMRVHNLARRINHLLAHLAQPFGIVEHGPSSRCFLLPPIRTRSLRQVKA